jgi:ankyrin repeat protein
MGQSSSKPSLYSNDFGVVEAALKLGHDPNNKPSGDQYPLHCALSDPCIVQLLIDNGADVNLIDEDDGETALHYCVLGNYLNSEIFETIEILLANGADINCKNSRGQTPLQLAHTTSMMRFLIQRGADTKCLLEDEK